MDLNKYYEQFTDALVGAFSIAELEQLLRFKFNVGLDDIVAPGAGRTRVFELIGWSDRVGKTDQLFVHALEKRPHNERLRYLAKQLAQEANAEHQQLSDKIIDDYPSFKKIESERADQIRTEISSAASHSELQAAAVFATGLQAGENISAWIEQLESARQKICSIGIGNDHMGTGFLISEKQVMTNAHVLDGNSLEKLDIVFDFIDDTNRTSLEKYKITNLVTKSDPRELDFALVELDNTPSNSRGWFTPTTYTFETLREPIHIIGHPGGQSMKLSYGVVFDVNGFLNRIAYSANTELGSSGSPVFRQNGDLVALHHHGQKGINNHGIPMKSILANLSQT